MRSAPSATRTVRSAQARPAAARCRSSGYERATSLDEGAWRASALASCASQKLMGKPWWSARSRSTRANASSARPFAPTTRRCEGFARTRSRQSERRRARASGGSVPSARSSQASSAAKDGRTRPRTKTRRRGSRRVGAGSNIGVGRSWARRLAAGEERDEPGEVGARGRADRAGRARERDREGAAEERLGVSGDEGLEGVGVSEVRE